MSELLRNIWNNDQKMLNRAEELLDRLGCRPGDRAFVPADESMAGYAITQVVFYCKLRKGVCARHLDDATVCPRDIPLPELRRYIPPTQGRSY